MTDLSQDAYLKVQGEGFQHRWFIDTSVAQHFYKGQPVLIDQSADTQNATPFVTALVVDPADVVLGICAAEVTVVQGDPETTEVSVWVYPTILGFQSAVFDNADLGKTVYMSDSATLSETAADNPEIGTLDSVDDGFAFVRLSGPHIPTGA